MSGLPHPEGKENAVVTFELQVFMGDCSPLGETSPILPRGHKKVKKRIRFSEKKCGVNLTYDYQHDNKNHNELNPTVVIVVFHSSKGLNAQLNITKILLCPVKRCSIS